MDGDVQARSAILPKGGSEMPPTRGYQQEMLDESLRRNIIIALDTGSGKTLIAVLRMKHEMEKEHKKLSWFFAPTVALCQQQMSVIEAYLPVSVGIVSGANEPDQWKDARLWERVLATHRIIVSTPQVFLDSLRHGYVSLQRHISLLVFDEAHHAVDNHPYNRIMMEFYFDIPPNNRPMVLGLTASPIYGGNVEKAFRTIEANLDSTIRAPRRNRSELAHYVHPPVFKHVMYLPTQSDPFSTNLASLESIFASLNIEDDPYVISLRSQLAKMSRGSPEYTRTDQKLSKVIAKESSFTHKGLADFQRAARDICKDIGPWGADWFVWRVLDRARAAANPYNHMMVTWKKSEKAYLLGVLDKIVASEVSYYPDDIADDISEKTRALIQCLLAEKQAAEALGETYSCIVFVQRRDAVLALAHVLSHHPATKDIFSIGTLLGSSDSAHRHSMMDITRSLVREVPQAVVLAEFKSGERNLIISTAVSEEGIDIQACGSVIRWDLPQNMASWAQSKGRARRKRSTFTMMFEEGSAMDEVGKWRALEERMRAAYNDPSRDIMITDEVEEDEEEEDEDMIFKVESTGALLTLHSAISHLTHFCAVIPNTAHTDNRPLFEIDPPEFPEGWHYSAAPRPQYTGPYGSKVTLPRSLPLPLPERTFVAPMIYKSAISAHRHSAFIAYKALYDKGLLDDRLLPMTSVVEPELEEEVKAMLAEVEKREGFARISLSIDPWAAPGTQSAEYMTPHIEAETWHAAQISIEGLAPLWLFTQSDWIALDGQEGPTLYRPGGLPPITTTIAYVDSFRSDAEHASARLADAREWTRTIFWSLNSTRMDWDHLDFSYLFLPVTETLNSSPHNLWTARRSWFSDLAKDTPDVHKYQMMVRGDVYGSQFNYPADITLVQRHLGFGRPFQFVEWRYPPLNEEEEQSLRDLYKNQRDAPEITYPLLAVKAYPPRSNFLIPTTSPLPPNPANDPQPKDVPLIHFLPKQAGVILLSPEETQYAFLLPSVLRFLSMRMTAFSLRGTLFTSPSTASMSPLAQIPLALLTTAITAPASGEQQNYQRMETLGDTVLKFVCGVNLLAEYPLWHEGYLTRKKDHAVSNVRLAKEDLKRGLYRWIIRDIMLGKKWRPKYVITAESRGLSNAMDTSEEASSSPVQEVVNGHAPERMDMTLVSVKTDASTEPPVNGSDASKRTTKKKSKKNQQLSTKVLADVVESIIGAAYIHGGFDLGYECIKFFDLGLKWEPLAARVTQVLARVDAVPTEEFTIPPQLADVERMLDYTFQRKLLLIEALTHASYQQDLRTPSYERMEFLGDSVLDMVVTDMLYHAPGKNYSPGHMHLRKSAVVNAHILSYFCLKTSTTVETFMPCPSPEGGINHATQSQEIYLWKCLLHSSPKVLEDQLNTATRFRKWHADIETSLMTGTVFPWSALTRLQAPKFISDMLESIIGGIYLDSGGSLSTVTSVLRRLGIIPLLEHIIADDVDVLHPVSRLSLWAQKHERQIQYETRKEGGKVSCTVIVDGIEEAKEEAQWRGKPSQEEVKYNVAEQAIKKFKLRDVGVGYNMLKKKAPKKKAAVIST